MKTGVPIALISISLSTTVGFQWHLDLNSLLDEERRAHAQDHDLNNRSIFLDFELRRFMKLHEGYWG
ncbi:hypothetical protein TNCV_4806591 [Trichonephila clavipes]|nr:hypothetical protein TNCV_4806591 [Trichonephila clavipes]